MAIWNINFAYFPYPLTLVVVNLLLTGMIFGMRRWGVLSVKRDDATKRLKVSLSKDFSSVNSPRQTQTITLPTSAIGVASDVNNTVHTLPDLDGEIYLKAETDPTADVNGDGAVNILDLVAVANAFGKDAPDVNGDGVVNILDLVAVANAFQ
ncbi:hypothetical protein J4G07_21890 [Candidatus Poribacteria bacterium]|nr:hypothetical protein [Candidatus Poribacteria bacterium]